MAEERRDRDARWERLLRRFREGDHNAREQLVAEMMPLVHQLARRYPGKAPHDDLVQAGLFGLSKALKRFDMGQGSTLSSYAVPTMLGELLVALRQARHVLDERERFVLHLRFAEDRTQTEIAERIGVSQMQVSRILRGLLTKMRLELRRQGAELAA